MQNDITQTTYTDMEGNVDEHSVDSVQIDSAGEQKETRWTYSDFNKWLGYYKKEMIKKPIDSYATWVVGRGYECELTKDKVILKNIKGWGEDSFLSIMWNMLVMKKVNGDSFAHIIRNDKGILINLKPLPIDKMVTIIGADGMILRYEQTSRVKGKKPRKYTPQEILHLVNDRVADEIHGNSVIEVCEWDLLAMKEAMITWRKICKRAYIRILYVDENDKTRLAELKSDYATGGVNAQEVLILPVKPGEAKFEDLTLPPVEAYMTWIRNCESRIYKAVGFPKSLTGDAEGIPESGGKMAYFNHMPVYNREVTDLEADFWNQLAIRITFNRQESLTDNIQNQESKNINQTQASQPSDTKV